MSLILQGSTSGSITLQEPAVAGTTVLDLPATSGTVALTSQLPATGLAFGAYGVVATTPSGGTSTKVKVSTEYFDTASAYDNATNYRFQPTVAGYYQINGGVCMNSGVSRLMAMIWKNGSEYQTTDINSNTVKLSISTLLYLNGSTDYVELYTWNGDGGVAIANNGQTNFNGGLVRAA
jgi:hypothetical protein